MFRHTRRRIAFRRRVIARGVGVLALTVCVAASAVLASAHPFHGDAQHSGKTSLTKLVQELGNCIHHHGAPNFPDPYITAQGQVAFPANSPDLPPQAQRACQWIINQLPNPGNGAPPAVSTATYQKWLQFASCMRKHGLPAWPDPNPDASFALPQSLLQAPSSALAPAFGSCRHLDPNPNGKYTVSESRS
jgi:hypothetical protein